MPSIICYLFCSLVVFQVCLAQDDTDVNIRCVPLRECPDISYLVKSRDQHYTHDILKLSNCGYDANNSPKVWCPVLKAPKCITPSQKPGRCKPIETCDVFKKLVENPDELSLQTKVLIYKHKCKDPANPRGFSVCCPSTFEPPVSPKPTVTPTTFSLLPRPSEGECGQQLQYRIIGGKATEMDEHPWTVLLEYDDGNELQLRCGGALISNRYVVTAAHCVDNSALRAGSISSVILGEYETRNTTDFITRQGTTEYADPPVKAQVEEIIVHPQWYSKPPATINHDIALIRLTKPVKFTDYIKAICLPSSNLVIPDNEKLEVVGWGQTEKGSASTIKLKTQIPVFNRNQCSSKYKQEKRVNVGDGEFCVGGEAGKDSCTGDSGGPLTFSVQRPEYTAWFLAGVVSFGPNHPCGVKNYPGLYTYVPKYVDWIHATVKP